jgi:hypothetical protein
VTMGMRGEGSTSFAGRLRPVTLKQASTSSALYGEVSRDEFELFGALAYTDLSRLREG